MIVWVVFVFIVFFPICFCLPQRVPPLLLQVVRHLVHLLLFLRANGHHPGLVLLPLGLNLLLPEANRKGWMSRKTDDGLCSQRLTRLDFFQFCYYFCFFPLSCTTCVNNVRSLLDQGEVTVEWVFSISKLTFCQERYENVFVLFYTYMCKIKEKKKEKKEPFLGLRVHCDWPKSSLCFIADWFHLCATLCRPPPLFPLLFLWFKMFPFFLLQLRPLPPPTSWGIISGIVVESSLHFHLRLFIAFFSQQRSQYTAEPLDKAAINNLSPPSASFPLYALFLAPSFTISRPLFLK